ncbi:hypothetical protein EG329_002029 [Mollisiaceae sp. DMI_Dod_QoI]|nr:hypothetical protein EG329_002029 [Helotiales sp. DMI_Dod_QoI]
MSAVIMSLLVILTWVPLAFATSKNSCAQNNCYRAFNGDAYTASAKSYCSKFTTATIFTANNIPWASKSCSMAAQVSSVCLCAYPGGTIIQTPISALLITSTTRTSTTYRSSQTSSTSSSTIPRSSSRGISITTVGVPPSAFQTSTTTYKQREFGPGCLANNCLRALDRYNANSFCSVFTLGNIGASSIPGYASPCAGSAMAQVSSACTCLNYFGNTMIDMPMTNTTIFSATFWSPLSMNTGVSSSRTSVMPSSTALTSTIVASSSTSSTTTLNTYANTVSGSSTSTQSATTINPLNSFCHSNNYLRALKHQGGAGATTFCAAFTTAMVTNTVALPTYATQCSTNPIAQLSSACSCIGSQAYATS